MKRIRNGLLLSFLISMAGCGEDAASNVDRVTPAQLKASLAAGTSLALDVRSADEYKQLHIKGAMNIPFGEVATRLNELPHNKQIVTYCA